jgi:hypothetical protein
MEMGDLHDQLLCVRAHYRDQTFDELGQLLLQPREVPWHLDELKDLLED